MITQLLDTMKEISTLNITQRAKPRLIFTCQNETQANNISDMITNQSERNKSVDLTSNNSIITNSEELKISLSEQLKNVKRQNQEKLYQFKSKQPIDNNMNELLSKQNHQGLYPSGTTVIVGDSIINGVIEERINKKDRSSQILRTIIQLVFFLCFLRSMKDVRITKCINTLTKFFLNISAFFAKVIILNIVY